MYGNNTNHTQIFQIVKENIFPHILCVEKLLGKHFLQT